MAVRGNVPVLFLLFFTPSSLLAGGLYRIIGPLLAGDIGLSGWVLFSLILFGFGLSLRITARILYLSAWRVRLAEIRRTETVADDPGADGGQTP